MNFHMYRLGQDLVRESNPLEVTPSVRLNVEIEKYSPSISRGEGRAVLSSCSTPDSVSVVRQDVANTCLSRQYSVVHLER